MIDDLVRFCLAEIAYEGELGCTIDRLKELIASFSEKQVANLYLSQSSDTTAIPSSSTTDNDQREAIVKTFPTPITTVTRERKQNVDDAYCGYVYSLIVKHPSIIIGTVPEGTPPVWIAPPLHKKEQAPPPISLNVVEFASEKTMQELKVAHGSTLRIAATKVACFVTITGTHNRPSKLTDVVYTTLQIITRARDEGVAIKDLGHLTKYDPKAIFFQISQLIGLGLIVKVSKGPSLNWAVHKRFYDQSSFWQKLTAEDAIHKDEDPEGTLDSSADLVANVPLLRHRVLRLLDQSVNKTHQQANLILAAGFENPTRHQRRFFTSRVSEMVDEGLVDRFAVPTSRGNAVCLQLTQSGSEELKNSEAMSLAQQSRSPSDDHIYRADIEDEEYEWTDENRFQRQIGIQRQIITCLENRPEGMIIKDLSASLGLFDGRTVEKVLTRLSSRVPPRHLVHLHPVVVMESIGKMRRQRYYTLKHYQAMLQKQNIPDDRYSWACMDDVGNFANFTEDMFWESPEDITTFIEAAQGSRRKTGGSNPRDLINTTKKRKYKNPIIDGVVKRGRPRKEWTQASGDTQTANAGPSSHARKRKRKSLENDGPEVDQEAVVAETHHISSPPALRRSKRKKAEENDAYLDIAQNNSAKDLRVVLQQEEPTVTRARSVDIPPGLSEPQVSAAADTIAMEYESPPKDVSQNQEPFTSLEQDNSGPFAIESQEPTSSPTKVYIRKAQKRRRPTRNESEPDGKRRKMEGVEAPGEQNESTIRDVLPVDVNESTGGPGQDTLGNTPLGGTGLSLHPARKQKQPKPKPTNYSQLKRHQEIMDVLREKGGILQINGELSITIQSHSKILENRGVETAIKSAFLMDKKTISKDVEAMGEKGLVKVLKTVVLDPNHRVSLQQPITIFYLPEVAQDEVQEFISGIHRSYRPTTPGANTRQIGSAVPFTKLKRAVTSRKGTSTALSPDTLLVAEPRHQFLEDRQTVAQMFGFLLGKCRRAQELYLFTLRDMLSDNPSPNILSAENRIVATDYWTEDLPLGSFCAIIPAHTYIPYLEFAQSQPEILKQPLKSFDIRLRRGLKIKHAAVKARLREILVILAEIQLITPLSESPNSTMMVNNSGNHMSLEAVTMPTSKKSPLPQFWRFEEQVPTWLLSLSKFSSQVIEQVPPFHRVLPTADTNNATVFWSFLQQICDRGSNFATLQSTSTPPDNARFLISPITLACLCNLRAWTANYRLSRLQEDYLKRMIDVRTLTSPLDDPTPARLVQASHITCAPQQVICDYFSARIENLKSGFLRLEARKKRAENTKGLSGGVNDALVRKAEKHLTNLGQRWDDLVSEVIEDEISADIEEQLHILRSRYITVGGMVDHEKLKDLVRNTLHNPVKSAKNRYRKLGGQRMETGNTIQEDQTHMTRAESGPGESRAGSSNIALQIIPQQLQSNQQLNNLPSLPPLLADRYKNTVTEIIDGMGRIHDKRSPLSIVERKAAVVGQRQKNTRRKRFVWGVEYEELLQDAVAVMRARCRGLARGMLWGPLAMVFPPVHANNVRMHFVKYVSQPGSANYMDRLEQGWYNLWQVHKERPELKDEEPFRAERFDLVGHIQFLRDYLDKQNLPQVLLYKDAPTTERVATELCLPSSVTEVLHKYHIVESDGSSFETSIQHYWGDASAYLYERHQAISGLAFTEAEKNNSTPTSTDLSLAQNVIQMIMATEPERYTELHASSLLRPFGDTLIKQATKDLSKRGVISKVPGAKAGRAYRMSESNVEDLSGKLPLRRCEDAAAVERVFEDEPDAWRVWSLDPSEGEMLALLQKVSSHEVDFKVQAPDMATINAIAMWNSRKIQDEMLEVEVAVLFDNVEAADEEEFSAEENDSALIASFGESQGEGDHGLSATGEAASCCVVQPTARHVNCKACLALSLKLVAESLNDELLQVFLDFMRELEESKGDGLKAELVWGYPNAYTVVRTLTSIYPPLAFWSGYSSCRLISANYLNDYAVWVFGDTNGTDQSTRHLVMPRRWIDMNGKTDESIWKAAQRAIIGQLITHPVINYLHLIEILHKVYDRLDVLSVLRHLEEQKILKRVCMDYNIERKVGEMTAHEEEHTKWELSERLDWQEFI